MGKGIDYYVQKSHIQNLNGINNINTLAHASAIAVQKAEQDNKNCELTQKLNQRYSTDVENIKSDRVLRSRIDKRLRIVQNSFDKFVEYNKSGKVNDAYEEICYMQIVADSIMFETDELITQDVFDQNDTRVNFYREIYDSDDISEFINILKSEYLGIDWQDFDNVSLYYHLNNMGCLINAGFFIYSKNAGY
ncbi:MAG: hypothetical protein E7308_07620 [Butyrivibrio sp.]|nr:hypothetical protein [Butyrivibrio sp.]